MNLRYIPACAGNKRSLLLARVTPASAGKMELMGQGPRFQLTEHPRIGGEGGLRGETRFRLAEHPRIGGEAIAVTTVAARPAGA